MTFQTAKLQTKSITNWNSFHSVFAETMGFPAFYGRNMDAWIDCMTSSAMASFNIQWRNSTKKDIGNLPRNEVARVIDAVGQPATDPLPHGAQKL